MAENAASLEQARETSLIALKDAWTELRGYVAQAVEDGNGLDAATLAYYMDELEHRTRAPIRAALAATTEGDTDGGENAATVEWGVRYSDPVTGVEAVYVMPSEAAARYALGSDTTLVRRQVGAWADAT